MMFRVLLAALACSLPVGTGLRAEEPEVKQEELTELGEQMELMSSAFRRLRRQAAEPAYNESSVELVAVIRTAATAAKTLAPGKAAELPEGERAEFFAAYRARMDEVIAKLDGLLAALRSGDNPAAVKLVAELAALQKAGHREFRKRERD
ncbi:MAG TPA: cytochrome b562 [Opitutaceae bacterium]|mgnify:CR=1 FL=1|nr:cytochrome b562 [Opitutaceae bacterium]HRJ47728.1 cytochrome b562 [Opitutaceae bacterium]